MLCPAPLQVTEDKLTFTDEAEVVSARPRPLFLPLTLFFWREKTQNINYTHTHTQVENLFSNDDTPVTKQLTGVSYRNIMLKPMTKYN